VYKSSTPLLRNIQAGTERVGVTQEDRVELEEWVEIEQRCGDNVQCGGLC